LSNDGSLTGTLIKLRAEYKPKSGVVSVCFDLGDRHFVNLFADHVQTRATIASLLSSLADFDRLRGDPFGMASSEISPHAQVYCDTHLASQGEDEEARFAFLPQRDCIRLTARFSEEDTPYVVLVFLTRADAEALLHDLRHALADMERFSAL